MFANSNYRLRIIPFHYLVATPNIILQELLTLGFSRNVDETLVEGGMVRIDYDILKYEAKLIYLTKFHTRFFLAPFLFGNQYAELPARSADGTANPGNPKLRETGFGVALGESIFHRAVWVQSHCRLHTPRLGQVCHRTRR